MVWNKARDNTRVERFNDGGIEMKITVTKTEGDICGFEGCQGILEYVRQTSCSCHINPPCSACTDAPLVCGICEEEIETVFKMTSEKPWDIKIKTLADLDKTKIDSVSQSHPRGQMLVGVYPEGTTMKDIEKHIGYCASERNGRFEQLGGGIFKFIEYTD